jgi:hypothetical protein
MNCQIVMLTYSSRSGSTYLARVLADNYKVLVVPETQSPYWFLSHPAGSRLTPVQVARALAADRQLTWDVPLPEHDTSIQETIELIVNAYARSRGLSESGHVLMKLGSVHRIAGKAREHIPDVRFLNVVRDGRAVINSQLTSQSPYLVGASMGHGDSYRAARLWASDVERQVEMAAAGGASAYLARYENFVADEAAVIPEIGAFFGWIAAATDDKPVRFAVRAAEEGIHTNIYSPALPSRLNGWEKELRRRDRLVIETLAGEQLRCLGYGDFERASVLERATAVSEAWAAHLVIELRIGGRRLGNLRGPADVARKVRYAAARYRSRR